MQIAADPLSPGCPGPVLAGHTSPPVDFFAGLSYILYRYVSMVTMVGIRAKGRGEWSRVSGVLAWFLGRPWLSGPVGAFALFAGFSAVYLQHHHFFDVIAGALFALAGSLLARMVMIHHRAPVTIGPSVRWDQAPQGFHSPGKGV